MGVLAFQSAAESEPGAAAPFAASRPEVREAIAAVVHGQLAAFRADDMSRAYGFAAAAIQRQFTERQFAAMVRQGYPAVVRHRDATVGAVFDNGTGAIVSVRVMGADRILRHYSYILLLEADGWRIAGVRETPPPPERPAA